MGEAAKLCRLGCVTAVLNPEQVLAVHLHAARADQRLRVLWEPLYDKRADDAGPALDSPRIERLHQAWLLS